MFLQKKASFNLIQFKLMQGSVEDFRDLPFQELEQKFNAMEVPFAFRDFLAISGQFESPEELAAAIAQKRSLEEQDRLYLLCFELWRRHCHEKQTLSIFCDELDHAIMHTLQGKHVGEMPDLLAYLEQILLINVDEGIDPHEAFSLIQTYLASDLESFLYDFTLAQIEAADIFYARDLISSFLGYVQEQEWFSYLSARVLMLTDPMEGSLQLEALMRRSEDLELKLEILQFLGEEHHLSLFTELALKILPLLQTEEDLVDLLHLTKNLYRELGLTGATALNDILQQRNRFTTDWLDPKDPSIREFARILQLKVHC